MNFVDIDESGPSADGMETVPEKGSYRRRGISFYLRIGLLGIASLTIFTILLSFLTFNTVSVELKKVAEKAIPTIEKSNRLINLARSIDSQARNLPNLHEPFAIGFTAYRIKQLGRNLDLALDDLDPNVAGQAAIDDVRATIELMNRQVIRLRELVEGRSEIERKRIDYIHTLDILYRRIENAGKSMANAEVITVDRASMITAMLRGANLLIASQATQDPSQVLDKQNDYRAQLAIIDVYMPPGGVQFQAGGRAYSGEHEKALTDV